MNKVTKKRRNIKNQHKSIKKRDVRKRRRSRVSSNNKTKRVYTGGAVFSRKKKEETISGVGTSSGWNCRCRFAEKSQENPVSTTKPVPIYDIPVERLTPPSMAAAAAAAAAATLTQSAQQYRIFTRKDQPSLFGSTNQRKPSQLPPPPPPPPPQQPPPPPESSYVRKRSVMTGLTQHNLKKKDNKIAIKDYNKTTNTKATNLSELSYESGSERFKNGDVILQINGKDVDIYDNENITEKFKSATNNNIQNGKITFTVHNSKAGSIPGKDRIVTIIPKNHIVGQGGGATPEETTKNVICECKKRSVVKTDDV